LCQRLIAAEPQDGRGALALSKHLPAQSGHREALDRLLDALR